MTRTQGREEHYEAPEGVPTAPARTTPARDSRKKQIRCATTFLISSKISAQTATNRDQPLEIKMPQKKAATFSVPTAEPHIPPIETERPFSLTILPFPEFCPMPEQIPAISAKNPFPNHFKEAP
jgi:hypothetical protein